MQIALLLTIGNHGKGKVKIMSALAAIAYVIACGFTAAGFVAALFRAIFEHQPAFYARFNTPALAIWSLVLCTFAGPWILVSASLCTWRDGRPRPVVVAAAALVSAVWSFCSGVVLVQLAALAGIAAV